MVAFEYHGFSAFSLFDGDTHILVDPWISEPDWGERSIEYFDDVDYLFVTHGAFDHLGDTRRIARRSGAEVITEPAVADHLVESGVPDQRVTRMIWGNRIERNDVAVKALETRHLSYFESGEKKLSGLPLGFFFDFDAVSLYNVGDTSIFKNIQTFSELYEPDWATVPVGGAPGHLAFLPPEEAALTAKWLSVDAVIPIHYPPDGDDAARFERELETLYGGSDRPEVHRLDVGDRIDLSQAISVGE